MYHEMTDLRIQGALPIEFTRRYDVPVRHEGGRVIPRCLTALVDGAGYLRAAYDSTGLGRLQADLVALLGEDGLR